MKYIKLLAVAAIVGAFVQSKSLAGDGVKILSKTKDISSGITSSTNIYLTDNNVLLENRGARDNGAILFDASKEEFRFIDHSRREYYVFDKQTLKQLKDQIKMMVMMMRQFADQMPEDQRKKLDKLMNPDAGSNMEFKATKKSEKIKKWKTTKYEGFSEGSKITELYIASFETIGIDKASFDVMQTMIAYFKQNLNEITTLLPAGGSFSQIGFDESSPVFKSGIPVKTISFDNGKPKDENVVESISAESISENIFAIPAGYQRKTINMQNQLGR